MRVSRHLNQHNVSSSQSLNWSATPFTSSRLTKAHGYIIAGSSATVVSPRACHTRPQSLLHIFLFIVEKTPQLSAARFVTGDKVVCVFSQPVLVCSLCKRLFHTLYVASTIARACKVFCLRHCRKLGCDSSGSGRPSLLDLDIRLCV